MNTPPAPGNPYEQAVTDFFTVHPTDATEEEEKQSQDQAAEKSAAPDDVDDEVPHPTKVIAPGPTRFTTVNVFVRDFVRHMWKRRVGTQAARRWSATWWASGEAVSRLEALRRDFDNPRISLAAWWREFDRTMGVLTAPDGPFSTSQDKATEKDPLPHQAPPEDHYTTIETAQRGDAA